MHYSWYPKILVLLQLFSILQFLKCLLAVWSCCGSWCSSSWIIFLLLYQNTIASLLFPVGYCPCIYTQLLYYVLFWLELLFCDVYCVDFLLYWGDCAVVPMIFSIFIIALVILVSSWDDESVCGLILFGQWVNFMFLGIGASMVLTLVLWADQGQCGIIVSSKVFPSLNLSQKLYPQPLLLPSTEL